MSPDSPLLFSWGVISFRGHGGAGSGAGLLLTCETRVVNPDHQSRGREIAAVKEPGTVAGVPGTVLEPVHSDTVEVQQVSVLEDSRH